MLVYLNMTAETIEPVSYRTGKADRTVALGLAIFLLILAPGFLWVSGPFLWPWGAVAGFLSALGGAAALTWWRIASTSVEWFSDRGVLEFRPRRQQVELNRVTKIEVRPARMVTLLWSGGRPFRLSHRLVGLEALLDSLRLLRPELFPPPGAEAVFRVSQVGTLAHLAFVGLTVAAGVLLTPWLWGWGLVLEAGALLALGRLLFFAPREFVVRPGLLLIRYWLRRRTYRGLTSFQESHYAATGAIFFRARLTFGRRTVLLDEGSLLDPLRPWMGWVTTTLESSPSD